MPQRGSDTLNSPQGDGNLGRVKPHHAGIEGQTPSIPRKGTETWRGRDALRSRHTVRHPQFPARGRKLHQFRSPSMKLIVRHPQFPARGRKLGQTISQRQGSYSVRHPQFPARGRKQVSPYLSPRFRNDLVRHPQFPARGRKPN